MKNVSQFRSVFFLISMLMALIYTVFGVFCCWGIGSALQSPAIDGLEKKHKWFMTF